MAGVDHTTIVWKNGEYIPDPVGCPFEYARDGEIIEVLDPFGNMFPIWNDIKWHRYEYDALYYRDGIDNFTLKDIFDWWAIKARLKWLFRCMTRAAYQHEVGVWKRGDTEIYIYHEPLKQSYASFCKIGEDTYIVLGGYGHWENVYCHFMHRGYGEAFEREMAAEAFHWLCDDVLETIADHITDDWDAEQTEIKRLRSIFYDPYPDWYMVEL